MDKNYKSLSFNNAFYLASKGGGKFFGKVGSFEEGYEFDAVVIDDSDLKNKPNLNIKERLEKIVYLYSNTKVIDKYISGHKVKI